MPALRMTPFVIEGYKVGAVVSLSQSFAALLCTHLAESVSRDSIPADALGASPAFLLSTFMRTLTASRGSRPLPLALAPAFVDPPSSCRLALPQRPSRHGSCAEWTTSPHLSSIIHTGARSYDAQLGMLCALAFSCSPRSLRSRGGRFFGLAPLLFAFAAVCMLWNECKSPYFSCATGIAARLVHVCEAAAAATCPHLHTSYACQWWWMETEGRVDEDREVRRRGWECRWRRSAGTVEAGTYSLPLPSHPFSPVSTLAPAQGEC
ncbi:hypothetical protein B0H13DRAFT_2348709 [Mycena leptocephala]|nr:hypothetical protein B0H13DRAFT_2348709 [Mycena leptocephala]